MEYLYVITGLIAVAGVFAVIQKSNGKKHGVDRFCSIPVPTMPRPRSQWPGQFLPAEHAQFMSHTTSSVCGSGPVYKLCEDAD